MSDWYTSDYDRKRQEEREERDRFRGDVTYESYRRGLNSDRASDCADDCYYAGRTPEQCVDGYQREIRDRREAREYAEYQEQQQYEEERHRWEQEQYPEPSPPSPNPHAGVET